MFDLEALSAVEPHADEAALIEQIAWLEQVKSAAIGAVICAVLVVLILINPGIGWFALGGLTVGWLISDARHGRWRRFAIAFTVIGVGLVFASAIVVALLNHNDGDVVSGPGDIRRVEMSSIMKYSPDKQAFEITDTMKLSDEDSTAICETNLRPDTAPIGPVSADAGDPCARVAVAVAVAGWSSAGEDTGRATFTRSRQSSVVVPSWPLSITRSVETPSVDVGNLVLVPNVHSTATIIGPERFVRASSPPAWSIESRLDGSEAVKVPMDRDNVRLKLVSPIARNPIVGAVLHFSWWGLANWIVLLIAAVFQDQVKSLLKWPFGAAARRAGGRNKTITESADNVQTAKASTAIKGTAIETEGGRHRR